MILLTNNKNHQDMIKLKTALAATCLLLTATSAHSQTADDFVPYQETALRLPSVPLFTNDPYFSFWSPFDRLNDGTTRHWSDAEKAMDGILRVDGKAYRFMGKQREYVLPLHR